MAATATYLERQSPSFLSALWLTGVLLRVVLSTALLALSLFDPLTLAILSAIVAVDLAAFVWGLNRYANAAGHHLNSTGRFWSVTGGFAIFLMSGIVMGITWWLLFQDADVNVRFENKEEIAASGPTPPKERYVAETTRDGQELVFKGVVAQGADFLISEEFSNSDRLQTLILNSPGGNVREARRMAETVMANGISTHVANECSASCLLVFMAGQQRTLGPGAQLGFHRYGLDFVQVLPHVNPLREMRTDQQYYLERGLDLDFLDKVFDLDRSSIWYPSRNELVDAGVLPQ
ncbi:hypothetical protein [Cognatishimia activa]|uniref:COG3904 family protein n=1 Tax=Cognatishimia activa TaxID=1715691 RepID=UPI0006F16F58|nr:hypothetical protein [Cognatishimia activa]CUI78141.1 hypothetical protein TA5113_01448 [Cognatishimia activa]